jgi:HK97 family phage major capsid protein
MSYEITQERNQVLSQAEAMLDECDAVDRPMTGQEETKFNSLVKKAKFLETKIEASLQDEAAAQHGSRIVPPQNNLDAFGMPSSMSEPVGTAKSRISMPGPTMKCFDNTRDGRESAFRAGKWIQATLLQDESAAKWCRDNGMKTDIMAAHSGSVNTAGGAVVPEEMERAIINLREEYGVYRQNSRVVTMGSDTLLVPRRTGGLTSYFVGEGAEGTESDTSWDNVTLTAKKLMVLSRMSSELNEDSIISMSDMLVNEAALSFSTTEDNCGFLGDGTSTFGGIQGINNHFENETLAGAVDATSGTDTVAEIALADLMNVVGALPTYALRGAKWYTSQYGFAQVFMSLAGSAGGNTHQTLSGEIAPNFLGYPIVVSQVLPSTGTINNSPLLLFGDLSLASTMGDRRGIRFRVSEERFWELDQLGVKATERFDIANHDLGDSTTAGPLVALMGNT